MRIAVETANELPLKNQLGRKGDVLATFLSNVPSNFATTAAAAIRFRCFLLGLLPSYF